MGREQASRPVKVCKSQPKVKKADLDQHISWDKLVDDYGFLEANTVQCRKLGKLVAKLRSAKHIARRTIDGVSKTCEDQKRDLWNSIKSSGGFGSCFDAWYNMTSGQPLSLDFPTCDDAVAYIAKLLDDVQQFARKAWRFTINLRCQAR